MFENKHKYTVDNTPFEIVHGCKNTFTLSCYTAPMRSGLDTLVNRVHNRCDDENDRVELK